MDKIYHFVRMLQFMLVEWRGEMMINNEVYVWRMMDNLG